MAKWTILGGVMCTKWKCNGSLPLRFLSSRYAQRLVLERCVCSAEEHPARGQDVYFMLFLRASRGSNYAAPSNADLIHATSSESTSFASVALTM